MHEIQDKAGVTQEGHRPIKYLEDPCACVSLYVSQGNAGSIISVQVVASSGKDCTDSPDESHAF